MKYLITILVFFIIGAVKAQYIPNASAYSYKGILTRESLQLPQGCGQPVTAINAPDNSQAAFYWDSCGSQLYIFSPKSQTWLTTSGSSSTGAMDTAYVRNDTLFGVKQDNEFFIAELAPAVCANGLNQPGYVTWSGTGLTFDVTGAKYTINCLKYTSLPGQITLDPADPSLPRRDVIGVDTNGAIIKITGVPSANPIVPQVDPNSQVYLTHIDVPAGSTIPGGIDQNLIYDENAEVYSGTAFNLTANFDNTVNPYHLSKSIDISNWSTTTSGNIYFTRPSKDDINNYNVIKLLINLKAPITSSTIGVYFYNGTSKISNSVSFNSNNGFSKTISGTYQNVVIPLTAFTFTSTQFDRIRIYFTGTGPGAYIDYVQFQGGIAPPPVTGIYQDTTYARNDSLFGMKNKKEFFISHTGGSGSADTLYYNVKWFGAKGDSVTDDGPAIQAAVDWIHDNAPGSVLFFPAGNYRDTSHTLWKSNVNALGVGPASHVFNDLPTTTRGTQIIFQAQNPVRWGNMTADSWDTSKMRYYDLVSTSGNKVVMSNVDSFAVGQIVIIRGSTAWQNAEGQVKPYVVRVNRIDSIAGDTLFMEEPIDTALNSGKVGIDGHFFNAHKFDIYGTQRKFISDVNISNMSFSSYHGQVTLGNAMFKCHFDKIWTYGSESFGGNGEAYCTFNNFNIRFWKQAWESSIGTHDTRINNLTATWLYDTTGLAGAQGMIKFGENVHKVVFTNLKLDGGTTDRRGIWFGPSTDCGIDGITMTATKLSYSGIHFGPNDGGGGDEISPFDDSLPVRGYVLRDYVKNGNLYLNNTTRQVMFERTALTDARLENNYLENLNVYGSPNYALMIDGRNSTVRNCYFESGAIYKADSLHSGVIEDCEFESIYDVQGTAAALYFKNTSDHAKRIRTDLTDLRLRGIPDSIYEGQLYYNGIGDALNFTHNGITTNLLNASAGTTLQPLQPGFGILGSNYDGTSPQVWAVDTSVLNDNIFIDSSSTQFFVDTISNIPPVSAVSGAKVLVGTSPSGAFAGHANEIATLTGSVWNFEAPSLADNLIVSNNTQPTSFYQYSGSNWLLRKRAASIGGDLTGANYDLGELGASDLRLLTNGLPRERIDLNGRHYLNNYTGTRADNYLKIDSATGRIDTASFTPLTLTTTGTSGAATLINNNLNIPVYSGGGGGGSGIRAVYAGNGLTKDNDSTLSLTAPVSNANGGTNQTTYAKGDILYASATNTLSKLGIGATGQPLTVSASGVPAWGSYASYDSVIITRNGLGGTPAAPAAIGLRLQNTTAAVSATPQAPPLFEMIGNAFQTTASQSVPTYFAWRAAPSNSSSGTYGNGTMQLIAGNGSTTGTVFSVTNTGTGTFTNQLNVTNGVATQWFSGSVVTSGNQIFMGAGVAGSGTYKTSNAGSPITPYLLSSVINTAGDPALMFDKTNGLGFGVNNSNSPTKAIIQNIRLSLTDIVSTAGSESASLGFYTQTTAGSAAVLVAKLTSAGAFSFTRPNMFTGSTPSNTPGTGAGTGPTITVTGNDAAGYITITTGSSPTASGDIVTVTFATALSNTPKSIVITPGGPNAATELAKFYVDQSSASASSWKIKNTSSALTASTTYIFYYLITQ